MVCNGRCGSIPSLRSYVKRIEEAEEKLIQNKLNEEVCIIPNRIVDSD